MKYYIIKSRDLYIVFDENNQIISHHLSINEANEKIRKLEYIELIRLLMTDY